MSDPRLTPANGRVAARSLAGQVTAQAFVDGWQMQVAAPVVDLCDQPGGARERQVLFGASVTVFELHDGWAFVQAANGYVGYIRADLLGAVTTPTHVVGTVATHAYAAEDFKSPDLLRLTFGAQVAVIAERRKFYETAVGFIPKKHLRERDRPFSDPASVAQLHFGVPYLWGGNSTLGLDCSGLVSAGLEACGLACPGDSDLQQAALGADVTDGSYQRGDLMFWKGHVGMMVDTETLIHANAHQMATTYEPIAAAITRIAAQGDGAVTGHKRL